MSTLPHVPQSAPPARPVLLQRGVPAPRSAGAGGGGEILAAAGLVLSLVATSHLALLWVPSYFGTAAWEFAAATQTIDVFPLAVTGAALLGWSSVSGGWSRRAVALVLWCILSSLVLLGSIGLIVLDLPVAWRAVTGPVRGELVKTGAKALGLGGIFLIFYLWLAVRLLQTRRQARARR